jgi:hypothetical protein
MPTSPPGAGEGHGLEQELPSDVTASRADGFAHADFGVRWVTETTMMFITPLPPIIKETGK